MTAIQVMRRDGGTAEITAEPGVSLMESLRQGGVNDIMALCGGNCSCATCHVYIDDQTGLAPKSEDEADMLDSLVHQRDQSRLSCQVMVSPDITTLSVEIAPEE